MVTGLIDEQKDHERLLRFGFYRIHQSLVEKPLSLNDFWHIDEIEDEKNTLIIDKEVIEKMKKKYNLK